VLQVFVVAECFNVSVASFSTARPRLLHCQAGLVGWLMWRLMICKTHEFQALHAKSLWHEVDLYLFFLISVFFLKNNVWKKKDFSQTLFFRLYKGPGFKHCVQKACMWFEVDVHLFFLNLLHFPNKFDFWNRLTRCQTSTWQTLVTTRHLIVCSFFCCFVPLYSFRLIFLSLLTHFPLIILFLR